ncbi:MAG: hypothetical protein H7222_11135 [Methylotenera sp.]|nr:hypothetical protein [Oligoflexia bacterium]
MENWSHRVFASIIHAAERNLRLLCIGAILLTLQEPAFATGRTYNVCFVTLNSNDEKIMFGMWLKGFPAPAGYVLPDGVPFKSNGPTANDTRIEMYELANDPGTRVAPLDATTYATAHRHRDFTLENLESFAPLGGCQVLLFSGHHDRWQPTFYGEAIGSTRAVPVNDTSLDISKLMSSEQVCNVTYRNTSGRLIPPPSYPRLVESLFETWLFACNTMRAEVVLSVKMDNFPAGDAQANNDLGGVKITDSQRMSVLFGNSVNIAGWDCKGLRGKDFAKSLVSYLDLIKKEQNNSPTFYSEHLDKVDAERPNILSLPGLDVCKNQEAGSCLKGSYGCALIQQNGASLRPATQELKNTLCSAVRSFAGSGSSGGRDFWFGPPAVSAGATDPSPNGHFDYAKVYGRYGLTADRAHYVQQPCIQWQDNITKRARLESEARSSSHTQPVSYCDPNGNNPTQ